MNHLTDFKFRHILDIKSMQRFSIISLPLNWAHRINDHYRNVALKDAFQNLSGRLLDFGCGEKPYQKLLQTSKITEWIGLDLHQRTSGSDTTNKADYFFDGENYPFSENQFDIIIATQVLEHVSSSEATMRKLAKILKPGGTFVITVPMTGVLHEEPHDFARFTPYGMAHIAHLVGLKLITTVSLGGPVTVVTTIVACHLNWIRRIPAIGPLFHALIVGTITQFGVWMELALFKIGFHQAKVTGDYLFILNRPSDH